MNTLTTTQPNLITDIPFTLKELNSTQRSKKPWNVFLHLLYVEYKALPIEEKINFLINHEILPQHHRNHPNALMLVDQYRAMVQVASRHWRDIPELIRDGWITRTEMANNLPVIGVFRQVPQILHDDLHSHVTTFLTQGFRRIYTKVINKINLRRLNPNMEDEAGFNLIQFGIERAIHVGRQIRFNFEFDYMLCLTIFGIDYSNLFDYEIIHRTALVCQVAIASEERLRFLFELNNLFPFRAQNATVKGTVRLVNERGRRIIGTVEEELTTAVGEYMLSINLQNGQNLMISRPIFRMVERIWIYNQQFQSGYKITSWNPVRIKIHSIGSIHFLFDITIEEYT
jgi:hypothetical protein